MRITIASALFPPDIAEPAPYVKELAKRLAKRHSLTLVIYGYLPEKVAGTRMMVVNKRRPLPWRLVHYTTALFRAVRDADIIYAQNGSSVELPAALVALITRTPLVIRMGDTRASERAAKNILRRLIQSFVLACAHAITTESPMSRPEILPLEPYPTDALAAYEKSWNIHLETLLAILNTYGKR